MAHLRTTLELLAASYLHCRAGFLRSFTAIRKEAGLFYESFLQKSEVFAFVERNNHLKDLKELSLPALGVVMGC